MSLLELRVVNIRQWVTWLAWPWYSILLLTTEYSVVILRLPLKTITWKQPLQATKWSRYINNIVWLNSVIIIQSSPNKLNHSIHTMDYQAFPRTRWKLYRMGIMCREYSWKKDKDKRRRKSKKKEVKRRMRWKRGG